MIANYKNTNNYATVVKLTTTIPSDCTKKCANKTKWRVASHLPSQQACVDGCCYLALAELKKDVSNF
uniref:Uncharacterized protein n=1 Tax=Trichuris muris TaxID=70415 RepID=A0A5S6QPY3_TRIMR